MSTLPTRNQVLNLIWTDPYLIGHWVGFKDLTEIHNEWLKDFLFRDDDQTLLAHRGSYKTSDLSLFFAIHTIINPNENAMFFRKTDTDVSEVIKQTAKILDTGCFHIMVQALYRRDFHFIKCTDSEIHTDLCTSIKGTSQILGLGIGTSITGKHGDIIVTDDIVNIKDRVSRAERERTINAYMELQNVKNRNGRFINTGTPWHKDDAISIMPNVKKYDCYHTGLITRDKLKELRASMTDSLFSANYELRHIASKDVLFANPNYTEDESKIYNGIAHIDASYDGEDFTAFTIMKKTTEGFVAFGKMWQKHVDECLNEIEVYIDRFKAGTIYCEENADKGYLKKELKSRGLYAKGYYESQNKYVKIATHLKKAWTKIEWLDETDPDYMNQILDYSEFAEHDDAPDSAACLVRKFENKVHYNKVSGGI